MHGLLKRSGFGNPMAPPESVLCTTRPSAYSKRDSTPASHQLVAAADLLYPSPSGVAHPSMRFGELGCGELTDRPAAGHSNRLAQGRADVRRWRMNHRLLPRGCDTPKSGCGVVQFGTQSRRQLLPSCAPHAAIGHGAPSFEEASVAVRLWPLLHHCQSVAGRVQLAFWRLRRKAHTQNMRRGTRHTAAARVLWLHGGAVFTAMRSRPPSISK